MLFNLSLYSKILICIIIKTGYTFHSSYISQIMVRLIGWIFKKRSTRLNELLLCLRFQIGNYFRFSELSYVDNIAHLYKLHDPSR